MSYAEVSPSLQKDTHCQFATSKHFLHSPSAAKARLMHWVYKERHTYITFSVIYLHERLLLLHLYWTESIINTKMGTQNRLSCWKRARSSKAHLYCSAPLPCSPSAAQTSSIPQLCRMAHHFCLAQPFSWGEPPFAILTVRLCSARISHLFKTPILVSIVASHSAQACSDPDSFLRWVNSLSRADLFDTKQPAACGNALLVPGVRGRQDRVVSSEAQALAHL